MLHHQHSSTNATLPKSVRVRHAVPVLQCILLILASTHACHVLQLTEEGFGGSFLHLLHAIAIYESSGGGKFLVDHSKFPYRCDDGAAGGFADFFNYSGVIPWTPDAQAKVEAEEGQPCKHLDFLAVDHQVALLGTTWDDLDSIALKRIWHLTPAVQKEVNAALKDLRKLKRPTIAFHVRGGDLVGSEEELLFNEAPSNKGKELIDTYLKTYPDVKGGTCLFIGDDHKVIDETAATAQKRLSCKVFKRKKFHKESGFFQSDFNQGESGQRCSSTIHLLADMELMAQADYLVGSFDSNLPYIVQTMRFALYLKDRRTFVDASPKHRDWYEAVRKYFREQEAKAAPAVPSKPKFVKPKKGMSVKKKAQKGL